LLSKINFYTIDPVIPSNLAAIFGFKLEGCMGVSRALKEIEENPFEYFAM